jgi:nucleoside-diphosphate-sugar epimerase
MKVLLTGAAGFVGSRVARVLLRDGCEVHACVRSDPAGRLDEVVPDLQLQNLDLRATDELDAWVSRVRPDLAVHCAWYATPGTYLTSPENLVHVEIGLSLARALAANGCRRLIGIGTCFEYAPSLEALSEDSPVLPATVYAQSKLELARALEVISTEGALDVAWARLFYLYGPFEDPRRLVPSVTRALLDLKPARTTTGDQTRDFLHVDDVAEALWAVARSDVAGPVNIGSGRPTAVRTLVLELARIIGRPELIELGAVPRPPDDPPAVWADNRRLVEECGWSPRFTLEEGLHDAVAWWRSHRAPSPTRPE